MCHHSYTRVHVSMYAPEGKRIRKAEHAGQKKAYFHSEARPLNAKENIWRKMGYEKTTIVN